MALRHARDHRHQQAAEEADEQRVRRRAARARTRRSTANHEALRRIQREGDRQPREADEQHAQQRRHRDLPRPPVPQQPRGERATAARPAATATRSRAAARARRAAAPAPRTPPSIHSGRTALIAGHDSAGEERNHAMADREVDRQQQREAADLDRGEHQARDRADAGTAMYSSSPSRPKPSANAQLHRMPGAAAVAIQRAARAACVPMLQPASVSSAPAFSSGSSAERSRQRQQLAAEQAEADRHVVPRAQRRQAHPARKHRQQEAEHERRQHLVLHDDRVQPAGRNRRLRHADDAASARR